MSHCAVLVSALWMSWVITSIHPLCSDISSGFQGFFGCNVSGLPSNYCVSFGSVGYHFDLLRYFSKQGDCCCCIGESFIEFKSKSIFCFYGKIFTFFIPILISKVEFLRSDAFWSRLFVLNLQEHLTVHLQKMTYTSVTHLSSFKVSFSLNLLQN